MYIFFFYFSEAGGLLVMALLGSAMAVMSHVAPAFAGAHPKNIWWRHFTTIYQKAKSFGRWNYIFYVKKRPNFKSV